MKTPKEYTDNIKNGIITTSMLEAALYSVNKRAKNYRNLRLIHYSTITHMSVSANKR